MANVVQSAERRPQARAERFDHLGRQRLTAVDFAGIDAGLDPLRSRFSQRAGRASGHQRADLVEFKKLERVRVHGPSRPRSTRGNHLAARRESPSRSRPDRHPGRNLGSRGDGSIIAS